MGFIVLPALLSDISDVYDVYFAAFKDNAVTKALFPFASSQDMTDAKSEFRRNHTLHTSEYWKKDSTQYTMKCVDLDSGRIVGMALWDIYLTPSAWEKGEISWLQGQEKERAEQLISPLWEARERLWHRERYIYCHVVAVHPEYQRQGIGQTLVDYGISVAKQTHLPIYIESSRDGRRLYEKLGCRKLEKCSVKEVADRKSDAIGNSLEASEVDLFIWTEGTAEALPKAVQILLK